MSYFTHRGKPYLGGVKNQVVGNCCAIATVNLFEAYAYKRGDVVKLSTQELFDFGTSNLASNVNYVLANGLMYEKDWPSTNSLLQHPRGLHSRVLTSSPRYEFPEFSKGIVIHKEEEFLQYVKDHPILIVTDNWPESYLDAFHEIDDWEVYQVPCERKGPLMYHAMLLVGYGTTKRGIKYYEVKNSGGEKWGDNGYGRISRDFPLMGVIPI